MSESLFCEIFLCSWQKKWPKIVKKLPFMSHKYSGFFLPKLEKNGDRKICNRWNEKVKKSSIDRNVTLNIHKTLQIKYNFTVQREFRFFEKYVLSKPRCSQKMNWNILKVCICNPKNVKRGYVYSRGYV